VEISTTIIPPHSHGHPYITWRPWNPLWSFPDIQRATFENFFLKFLENPKIFLHHFPKIRPLVWSKPPSIIFFSSPDLSPSQSPKLPLGEYPFLNNQPREGFLLDYLGHEEFFKGNDLFR
jgi:hypothetical protein